MVVRMGQTRRKTVVPYGEQTPLLLALSRKFKHLNCRFTWTFKIEDYVGKISTLGHNCSRGKAKSEVAKAVCEKYRECVHLRLTRCDFNDD